MKSESCKHTWIRVMIIAFVAVLFGWINGRQFFGDERIFLLLYCWGMGFVVGLYDWRIKKMTTKKFLYTMLAFLVVLVAMLVVIYVFDLKDDLFFLCVFCGADIGVLSAVIAQQRTTIKPRYIQSKCSSR